MKAWSHRSFFGNQPSQNKFTSNEEDLDTLLAYRSHNLNSTSSIGLEITADIIVSTRPRFHTRFLRNHV